MDAAVECLFFPKSHELYGPELRKDAVVSVHGQINNRDGAISVFAQDLTPIDVSGITSDAGHPVTLKLREERINPQVIEELRNVLKLHQGQVPLLINLRRIGRQHHRARPAGVPGQPRAELRRRHQAALRLGGDRTLNQGPPSCHRRSSGG